MKSKNVLMGCLYPLASWIVFMILLIIIVTMLPQTILLMGSHVHTGEGQYSGIIVETRHHGVFWKTNGLHLKSGENSSVFEDFCVLDKDLFHELQDLPAQSKIEVEYRKSLVTASWQCDFGDSNDIVTGFKVI